MHDAAYEELEYEPQFPPDYRPGIGVVGCGGIVKQSHLPAYAARNLRVVGAYDVVPAATEGVTERFGVERVYGSLDDLLGDPEIAVVDVATHPAERVALVPRALEAGKHVLSQKPLALDLPSARRIAEDGERRGLRVAVNQNGRWAPAWRIATLLIERGAIGRVLAVNHMFDLNYGWVTGTKFDAIPHFAIYDYGVHWHDIIRCWLEDARPVAVRARDWRMPHQPPESVANWAMTVEIAYADGESAGIRAVGGAATDRPGHPFWIHGTDGTIRGSVLSNDRVELERGGVTRRWNLRGSWFNDGFAGTMGELLAAIAEDREPYNSARHNLLSLELTLAACRSADADGAPIAVGEGPG